MRNKLEILLINYGYNQKLFAAKLGVKYKAFHYQLKRWENQPFSWYVKIAKALEISTKELLISLGLIV